MNAVEADSQLGRYFHLQHILRTRIKRIEQRLIRKLSNLGRCGRRLNVVACWDLVVFLDEQIPC